MKNVFNIVATVLIVATALTSCGNSTIKKNAYLDIYPAIYQTYELNMIQLKENYDKRIKYQTAKEIEKSSIKYKKKKDALEEEYKKDREKIARKIIGNEIPFTLDVQNINYSIETPVRITELFSNGCGFYTEFTVKLQSEIPPYFPPFSRSICALAMAGEEAICADMCWNVFKQSSFVVAGSKPGDMIPVKFGVHFGGDLNKWSDFSGLRFVDSDTYREELEKERLLN